MPCREFLCLSDIYKYVCREDGLLRGIDRYLLNVGLSRNDEIMS